MHIIFSHAKRLNELQCRLKEAAKKSPDGIEYRKACREFHDAYDELAFPGGLKKGLAELKTNSTQTVETAIEYLELKPYFFRSGYIAETLIRRLKHVSLTEQQKERLRRVILQSIDTGPRRVFHEYKRLAKAIMTPDFHSMIKSRQYSPNPEVKMRANAILHGERAEEDNKCR